MLGSEVLTQKTAVETAVFSDYGEKDSSALQGGWLAWQGQQLSPEDLANE